MKENSIEEDIKILESIIKINNDYLKGIENQTINQKEIKALEHILSDYKRVLKDIAFNIMDLDFELIEDEIDIDNMKEMELDVIDDVTYYINDLIKAVKQIDKRVKRLEEK